MKVLVCPSLMEIGGSQLNAIELAARLQRWGHEVLVAGPDGALVPRVAELGLEFHRVPVEHRWPTRSGAAWLTALVRDRGIDVVHGYEWGPALDLAYGPHLRLGTPLVVTVLSMDVPAFLPTHVPLLVGTRELAEKAGARHREVHLMEPPIDTEQNAPSSDPAGSRRQFGVADDELLLAVVCRLTTDLDKLAGVLEAIEVVDRIDAGRRIRLLVVGDGPGLETVRRRAGQVNASAGREVVTVTGGLLDPGPAYDAADVVLGMGSSALKGMAFGTPLVVQGKAGFWELLTPETAPLFLHQGWFGHGAGQGPVDLARALDALPADRVGLAELGAWGRRLVTERFSLDSAAGRLERLYAEAAQARRPRRQLARALAGPTVEVAKYKAVMASPRLRSWTAGRADDRPAVASR